MKPILFAIAIFCSTTVLAQDTTRSIKVMSMKGSDLNRMFGNVTDRKIYQRDGTIVDSVKAAAMVKSFEYETGFGTPIGQTEMKRIITRIDPKHKMETYQLMKIIQQMRLKSTRLQDGLTLDLKPIAKSVDTTKLTGKAIIMIFWCPGCYNGTRHDEYREVNNVISTYYNPDKL
ncbi:MAG: hypothetical protein H7289_02820 [Mucilaginibacter sp.]|nr:hypothetical protein [Mucilaginibacter sp.]